MAKRKNGKIKEWQKERKKKNKAGMQPSDKKQPMCVFMRGVNLILLCDELSTPVGSFLQSYL